MSGEYLMEMIRAVGPERTVIASDLGQSEHTVNNLSEETTYFFRVVAKDPYKHEVSSPTWSFSTIHSITLIGECPTNGSAWDIFIEKYNFKNSVDDDFTPARNA